MRPDFSVTEVCNCSEPQQRMFRIAGAIERYPVLTARGDLRNVSRFELGFLLGNLGVRTRLAGDKQ
jgi:hypothetical protein